MVHLVLLIALIQVRPSWTRAQPGARTDTRQDVGSIHTPRIRRVVGQNCVMWIVTLLSIAVSASPPERPLDARRQAEFDGAVDERDTVGHQESKKVGLPVGDSPGSTTCAADFCPNRKVSPSKMRHAGMADVLGDTGVPLVVVLKRVLDWHLQLKASRPVAGAASIATVIWIAGVLTISAKPSRQGVLSNVVTGSRSRSGNLRARMLVILQPKSLPAFQRSHRRPRE